MVFGCCLTLCSFPASGQDSWIAILPDSGDSLEELVQKGFPVIGNVGGHPIILPSPDMIYPDEMMSIPISKTKTLIVASAIRNPSPLPVSFEKQIIFSADNEYLLAVQASDELDMLTEAFELRRIFMRPWIPIPYRAPEPASRDIDPLIQEMIDLVSLESYQSIVDDLVSLPNRYSCSGEYGVQASQYLFERFQACGFSDVRYQDFDGCHDNVIARKEGFRNPERVWVIGAHYDTSITSPGADDNASGTAAIMELARIINDYAFEDTIEFVCFAEEELGLIGSNAYVCQALDQGMAIQGAICIDMIGYLKPDDIPDIDVIDNTGSNWMEMAIFDVIDTYMPDIPYKDSQLPNGASSDHASFWAYGYPAILLFEDYPDYSPFIHSPQDSVGVSLNSWELAMRFSRAAIGSLIRHATPFDPGIFFDAYHVYDFTGDEDGEADPGETVFVVVSLENLGRSDASNVAMTINTNDSDVLIMQNQSLIDTIPVNTLASNHLQPFLVHFHSQIPEDIIIPFDLDIVVDGNQQGSVRLEIPITRESRIQPYFWNMDTNPGWTIQGGFGSLAWQYGTPMGLGGSTGQPDPVSGYTGNRVIGYNLSGDYPNSMTQETLTTTRLDCSELTDTHLAFWYWLGVGPHFGDQASLQVSIDGTEFIHLWTNETALWGGRWINATFDISNIADGQSTVYIRWTMGPTSASGRYCGWNIDDVSIYGIQLPATPPTPCPTPDVNCIHNADVDGNGTVTAGDAQMTFFIALGTLVPSDEMACAADVNSDSTISVGDAQKVFILSLS